MLTHMSFYDNDNLLLERQIWVYKHGQIYDATYKKIS